MRDYVMNSSGTGFHLRGNGPWLSQRGGEFENLIGNGITLDQMDLRGSGWRDTLKKLASSAWSTLKRVVLPRLKDSGIELTNILAKKAAEKAQSYVDKAESLGPAKGLISQALLDLPDVVTTVVNDQLSKRFGNLDPDVQREMEKSGIRGGAYKLAFVTQNAMTGAYPILSKSVAEHLGQKFKTIEKYSDVIRGGGSMTQAQDLVNDIARLKHIRNDKILTSDEVALKYFGDLIESLIMTALQYGEKMGYIQPGSQLHQFLQGANAMVMVMSQNNHAPIITSKMSKLPFPKSQLCQGVSLLGDVDMDVDVERGGAFPIGLVATLVPAISSLIPSIIDSVKAWRGSGYDVDDDDDMLRSFIVDACTSSGRRPPARKMKCIGPPTKRSRKNY